METSDLIDKWAHKIIDRFDDAIHVEGSPSGRGVHSITRGVRREGVNTQSVEKYGKDRFFTITGILL
jgi:primase-polymerase (primpol)-like protein